MIKAVKSIILDLKWITEELKNLIKETFKKPEPVPVPVRKN